MYIMQMFGLLSITKAGVTFKVIGFDTATPNLISQFALGFKPE
jgi:hypothetical protein